MGAKAEPASKQPQKAVNALMKGYVVENTAIYYEQYQQLYHGHLENAKDGAALRAALQKCLELEKAGYRQEIIRKALCALKLSFAPTTTQRLSPKLREFEKDPITATLDKRRLRIERSHYKIEQKAGEWIIAFYSQAAVTSFNDTLYEYQKIRRNEHPEWPEIKDAKTIAAYLKEQQYVWMAAKYSQKTAEDALLPKNTLRRASFPDALWTMDGTTIDLQAADPQTGELLPALYFYLITDSHSNAILGFDFDYQENAALVQRTIKEAIRKTNHKPHQVKYDQGKANKAVEVKSLLDKITPRHFPAKAYSGRSKRVERIIQELQRLMKLMPNSTGGNVTAHSLASKANTDTLKSLMKAGKLPDYEGIKAQMRLIVDVYNNHSRRGGPSRWTTYTQPHEKRMRVEPLEWAQLFLTKRRDTVRYTNQGLVIELNGQPTAYTVKNERGELDPYFLRQYQDQSFEIHCDRDNPEWVALYQNHKQVAIATLKTQYAEAIVNKRPGEDAKRHAETENSKQVLLEGQLKYKQIMAETGTKLGFHFLYKDTLNDCESTFKMGLFYKTDKVFSEKKRERKTRRKQASPPVLSAERRGMSDVDYESTVLNLTSNNYKQ